MGKEKKIGLSVVGILMSTLLGVAGYKISNWPASRAEAAETPPKSSVAGEPSATRPKSSRMLDRLKDESRVALASATAEIDDGANALQRRNSASFAPVTDTPAAAPEASSALLGDRYANTGATTVVVESTPTTDPFQAAQLNAQPPAAEANLLEHNPAAVPLIPGAESTLEARDRVAAENPYRAAPRNAVLMGVEAAPGMQMAHEQSDTTPGHAQHATPTHPGFGHNNQVHLPGTVPGHITPGYATPQHAHPEGDRYAAPSATAHPSGTHYDVYGRDLPAEPDPPVARHFAPASNPSQNQYPGPQGAGIIPPEYGQPAPRNDEFHREQSAADAYKVRPNDSFWSISEAVYGNGGYFKALEEHNRQRVPFSDRMRVGDVVSTPPVKELEEKYPDLVPKRRNAPPPRSQMTTASLTSGANPGRIYKVQQGDTLFDIARYELGKASRWAEIYEMNRDRLGDDFDFLAPGTELRMPDPRSSGREPLTTQARPPYNR